MNIHEVTILTGVSEPSKCRSPQEIALKPENLSPEGGAAVAQQLAQKLSAKAGDPKKKKNEKKMIVSNE